MPIKSSTKKTTLLKAALSLPALAGLIFLVRMPLSWTDQAIFSGLIIACAVVIGRFSDSRLTTITLTFVSVFCTLRYGVWRWTSTLTYLNNSGWHVEIVGLIFALLLLLAEAYAICILLLGFFQSARPLERAPVPLPENTDQWPSVDVFVPTYSEPIEVVRPTVLAALGIDWPADRLHVYILDDGGRESFRELAEECGAGYIARIEHNHAKAGNINHALKHTKSDYIAIFDCDHIATRSFLQVTMGWFFKDNRLAMVQTPHHFYSPDPFERNLNVFRRIPNEGALFYGVVQDGNDLWNATFFCGSCAVIRRDALEEVGGIAVETVTEDAHTALRLQKRGWNTAYLGIPQAAGLATGTLSAHVGQRIRWARGMVQILRVDNPLFARGLTWPQRLCYFNCVVHYLYAIPRLIFVSAPLVYLLFGKSNLYGYIWEIIAYAAPHLVLSNLVNSRSQGSHRHSFWNEVYEMVLAPYILLPTTLALINPKWGKFNVTAKDSVIDESYFDVKIARPYIVLLLLNVIGLSMMIPRYLTGADTFGVLFINGLWAFLNVMLLGACIAVSFERKQRRLNVRIEAPLTGTLMISPDEVHHCNLIDLSESGLALKAERALHITEGQHLTTVLRSGDEEHLFRTEAVRVSGNRVHMRFLDSDLKHQRAITKLVYARADSWLDWTKDQARDRILGSMITILGIGAHGLWMLPSLLIKREQKKNKPAASPSVKPVLLPVFLLLFLFGSHVLQAQNSVQDVATPSQPSAALSDHPFQDTETLSEFGQKEALTLRGNGSRASINLSFPGSKIVSKATLALHYESGNVRSAHQTIVSVFMNDVEVAQIPLATDSTSSNSLPIDLPSDLLVHDNQLSFELHESCTKPCEGSDASAAWFRIEPGTELESTGAAVSMPNRLSMLPAPFFDPSVHRSMELQLVFGKQPDLETLKSAGIVASWYGALAAYRGAHFTSSVGQIPKGNGVMFVTSGSELAVRLHLADSSPSIMICDNPSDSFGKLLVFVATSTSDFGPLAQALAEGRVLSSSDRVALTEMEAFKRVRSEISSSNVSTQSIAIASGLNDDLLHVRSDSAAKLYFRLPADLDFGTRISVPLKLKFELSGLNPSDRARIVLALNGVEVTGRRLTEEDGQGVQSQSFAIPASLLYPSNTLTVGLRNEVAGGIQADLSAIDLRILRDSRLELGSTVHFVRMPRLDLFAASGFPFTQRTDLSETGVVIPAVPTMAQIGLYLDTVGFLSSQTGTVVERLNLVLAGKGESWKSSRNLLLIGSSVDAEMFRPFSSQMLIQPNAGHFVSGGFVPSWDEWLSRSWVNNSSESKKLTELLNGDMTPTFLVEEFANPFTSGGTVVVLATRSDSDTNPYLAQLGEEAKQGRVQGGLVLADAREFHSFGLNASSFTLGRASMSGSIYSWLLFHLWLTPLFVIALAFALARWWDAYLARVAEKRLAVAAA